MYAPVCLFTYNRLEETRKTLEALSANYLAKECDLIVFSDGAKSDDDVEKVDAVRAYLRTLSGFKSIKITEADSNSGLASSIISGVTEVLKERKKVIVLEDDLISAPNFLDFMNQALDFYRDEQEIFSISGYTMDLNSLATLRKDYYLNYRASSWGWATWYDRWADIDWEMKDYPKFKYNLFKQMKFMRGGSDLPLMLWKQMNGYLDSWAIRWTYHQFKNDLYCLNASKNKIINIGGGDDATHTKKIKKRHENVLEEIDKRSFKFEKPVSPNKQLIKEYRERHSFFNRLLDKLRLVYLTVFTFLYI